MRSFLKLVALGLLATVVTLVGMVLLPHAPYIRWQAVKTEAFARLGWMYERVHYDATPLDVAFLGTSHTLNGVDAAVVAQGLAAAGYRNAEGRCPTATNLAIPAYGRNLHWLIAREALENRKIDLLVVEVFENETRKAHPLFVQVATAQDVITAPILVNVGYPMDVARLPFRQLMLAMKSIAPQAYGLKSRFETNDYDGSTVDNTRWVNVGGVALTPSRDITMPPRELDAAAAANAANKDLNMLPERFERFEYAVPNHYVSEILDLAKAKGVRVVFLYLPGYGKPDQPYDAALYDGRGEMIFPASDLIRDKSLWLDADHLNIEGAQRLSRRLPSMIGPQLQTVGWQARPGAAVTSCSNGYPERSKLLPFRKADQNG